MSNPTTEAKPRPRPERKSAAEQALLDATALLNSQPTTTFEWFRWALLLPLSEGQKIVLAFIASRAGNDGSGAYPSKAMLARVARCDERSIHRHIVALRNLGLLSWEKRNSEAGRETNLYALHWQSPTDIQTVRSGTPSPTDIPDEPNGHSEVAQRTFEGSPTDIHECPTKTLEEDPTSKTHSEDPSRVRAQGPTDTTDSTDSSEPLPAAPIRENPKAKKATAKTPEKPLPTRPRPNGHPECPVGISAEAATLERARAVVAIAAGYEATASTDEPLAAAAEIVEAARKSWDQDIRGPEVEAILRADGFRIDRGRLLDPEHVA